MEQSFRLNVTAVGERSDADGSGGDEDDCAGMGSNLNGVGLPGEGSSAGSDVATKFQFRAEVGLGGCAAGGSTPTGLNSDEPFRSVGQIWRQLFRKPGDSSSGGGGDRYCQTCYCRKRHHPIHS